MTSAGLDVRRDSSGDVGIAASSAEEFWQHFVASFWERRTTLITAEQGQRLPHITPGELLPAVVACVDSFAAQRDQKVRFYADGTQLDVLNGSLRHLLPQLDDGTFERYHERLARDHDLEDYALIIADWHQFSRPLFDRIVGAVDGLTREVGVSASRMDTQIFIGTYRATPFGVHQDPASAFHFPVVGQKSMRFWADHYVSQTPSIRHAQRYGAYTDASHAITAEPGEVIYWPSDAWHVGESLGEFSVTWRFAYWIADGTRKFAIAHLAEALVALSPDRMIALPVIEASAQPATIGAIDDLLHDIEAAASSQRLRETIVANWLERYSAQGFLRVPEPAGIQCLEDADSVVIKPGYRVVAAPVDDERMCVAASGRSRVCARSSELESLIARMNRGGPIAISEVRSDVGDTAVELLAFCVDSGALVHVPGPARGLPGAQHSTPAPLGDSLTPPSTPHPWCGSASPPTSE